MDDRTPKLPARAASTSPNYHGWWLILISLFICQGWLSLRLFGEENSWSALVSDQPLTCGSHSLHAYHGILGAHHFRETGRTSGVDPSFNAGYLKTPWFDSGSRPAELFQWLAGGGDHAAPYKIGLFAVLCLLPGVVFVAAKSLGCNMAQGCLAAGLGILLLWSKIGRPLIADGSMAVYTASLLALLVLAMFARYHEKSSFTAWVGLTIASTALCFSEAFVWFILTPSVAFYWLRTAIHHRFGWHLALTTTPIITILANWFWLRDLFAFWWLRTDPANGPQMTVLNGDLYNWLSSHPIWKDAPSRILGLFILVAGFLGLVAMSRRSQSRASIPLGIAVLSCLGLAVFGRAEYLMRLMDTDKLLFPALLFCLVPITGLIGIVFRVLAKWTGGNVQAGVISGSLITAAGFFLNQPIGDVIAQTWQRAPLPLGFSAPIQETMSAIQAQTTSAGRILWEESADTDAWTAWLPLQTERLFIGGLGAKAQIEHAAMKLRDGVLAGRPLADWSDVQLADYCRIYNVAWVVCRSSAATERLQNWAEAEKPIPLPNGDAFFALKRQPSYFLVGNGTVVQADAKGLTLADLEPVDGQIVLSFHHHNGIQPSMNRIRIEKEANRYDAIPWIRLQVPIATPRLTLDWGR